MLSILKKQLTCNDIVPKPKPDRCKVTKPVIDQRDCDDLKIFDQISPWMEENHSLVSNNDDDESISVLKNFKIQKKVKNPKKDVCDNKRTPSDHGKKVSRFLLTTLLLGSVSAATDYDSFYRSMDSSTYFKVFRPFFPCPGSTTRSSAGVCVIPQAILDSYTGSLGTVECQRLSSQYSAVAFGTRRQLVGDFSANALWDGLGCDQLLLQNLAKAIYFTPGAVRANCLKWASLYSAIPKFSIGTLNSNATILALWKHPLLDCDSQSLTTSQIETVASSFSPTQKIVQCELWKVKFGILSYQTNGTLARNSTALSLWFHPNINCNSLVAVAFNSLSLVVQSTAIKTVVLQSGAVAHGNCSNCADLFTERIVGDGPWVLAVSAADALSITDGF
jgi:hypothetical protein